MINLDELSLRQLQQESSRAVVVMGGDNHTLAKFNKLAHHDSQNWYRAVIRWYIDSWGGLPSECGPGKNVKLISTE